MNNDQESRPGSRQEVPWPGYPYDYSQQGWNPPPKHKPSLAFGVLGLALVLGAGALGWTFGSGFGSSNITALPQQTGSHVQQVDNSGNLSDAVNKVNPGLVDVNTVLGLQGARAAGTGIVLTSNGEVLTNNHVVEGATSISVTDIGNGRTYQASVIGYDRAEDVAVLKLANASGLTTAPIGDSSVVSVGDQVAGVGNAGGVGGAPSVAAGRVTALNQSITASDESAGSSEQLTGLIQVAANIQPGDSGGPLVSTAGQVVGVDTAASQGYQIGTRGNGTAGGEGFAIPINQALAIARTIEAGTASDAVHIGPTALLGVSVKDVRGVGPVVQQLVSDGPAQQAGLVSGDVIMALDGEPIDSPTALISLLDRHHPGDRLTLSWLDQQGQQHTATVSLTVGPVG